MSAWSAWSAGQCAARAPMRLLVLGGTRFLGRHVVDAAIAAGHDVTIFTRGVTPSPWARRRSRISSAIATRARDRA